MTRRHHGVHCVGIVCSFKVQPREIRASQILYSAKQILSVRGCGNCPHKMLLLQMRLCLVRNFLSANGRNSLSLLTEEYYVLENFKVSHDGKDQHKPTRYQGGPSLCLRFLLNTVVPPHGSPRSTASSPSSAISLAHDK